MSDSKPSYTVCIGGEEYEQGKRAWTRIGAAWLGKGGCLKITLAFPAPIMVDSTTMLTLFPYKERE